MIKRHLNNLNGKTFRFLYKRKINFERESDLFLPIIDIVQNYGVIAYTILKNKFHDITLNI